MIDLLETIEEAYAKGRYMPCLVLLYSGMDVAASLEPSMGNGISDRFKKWVDRYMIRSGSLPCTASDLYGARCAVIHTFTPNSQYSKDGKARVVGYAFGSAKVEILDQAAVLAGQTKQVNVHVRILIDLFRNGFADYIQEIGADSRRRKELETSAGLWSVSIATRPVEDYILTKSSSPTSPME